MNEHDNHECGCGCEHDEEMETMFLTLDDDTELECIVLGVFEVDEIADKSYIALLPKNDETVLIYEYKEDGEEVELSVIEDDGEFDLVSNAFNDLYDDAFEDEE